MPVHAYCALRGIVAAAALSLLLEACTSTTPAPVVERSGGIAGPAPTLNASPAPGTYVVKAGDTVYSVARAANQDYRLIAQWNGLDPSYRLRPGQVLQVVPPSPGAQAQALGDAQTAPVGAGVVESRPLGAPPAATAGAGTASGSAAADLGAPSGEVPVKIGPIGLRQPYSDSLLADMARSDDVRLQAPASDVNPNSGAPAAAPPMVAPAGAGTGANPPAAASDQGWIWPAPGPIVAPYNDPNNKGIDIGGKVGAPVVAAAGGLVLFVGNNLRGLGNVIIVKHSDDFVSVYAHNSKMLVAERQTVQKGDKIAEIGTGENGQAALHFEIRRQGKPLDPLKFLPPR